MNTVAIVLALVFGLQGDPGPRVNAVPVPECPSPNDAAEFITGFRSRHPEVTHMYLNCIKTNIRPDGTAPGSSTQPKAESHSEPGSAPRPNEVET